MTTVRLPLPPINQATAVLSAERLREVLRYDAETGLFWWIKTTSKKAASLKSRPAGCLNFDGYRVIRVDGALYRACRLAWLWQYGSWPRGEIDHKNCVQSDDRLLNLREATRSQNTANTRPPRRLVAAAKGVSWHAKDGKWRARLGGQWLGNFDTVDEASEAYKRAAIHKFGEFARWSV